MLETRTALSNERDRALDRIINVHLFETTTEVANSPIPWTCSGVSRPVRVTGPKWRPP